MRMNSENLNDIVKNDAWYQSLLSEWEKYEQEYLRIRDALPEEDQFNLDQYISFCVELEYRRGCLATMLPQGTDQCTRDRCDMLPGFLLYIDDILCET